MAAKQDELIKSTMARTPVTLYGRELAANQRIPLNLDWVEEVRVNTSAVERRAATLGARRSVKKEWQAAWLLRAITCMDLTTLSGDDSAERVRRLCAKARRPLQDHIVKALGIEELHLAGRKGLTCGAVCVYHAFVETAVKALEGSGIPVAAVSAGFPAGLSPLAERVEEIRRSVEAGASEIDIVITRAHVFNGEWNALYDEVAAFKEACGPAHMKSILGTGDLSTLRNVARASWVAMMAGTDFIKTSTGKEAVNATLPVSLVMIRALRDYAERTGMAVGFKPAGGIKTAKQALDWMATMKDELGRSWLEPTLFRYGASSMLGDIERQLEHFATGRYSAAYRHPIA
jgi:deoxyribose-phosphate aldolase